MKSSFIFFALLVTAKADVSHLKLNTERSYLPPVSTQHKNGNLGLTSGQNLDFPYTISKPRALQTSSLKSVPPHSNLHTFVADLPLKGRLFTAAGSDHLIPQASSDHIVYATAPNSVFHTQINVQSQDSEFNAPHTQPIAVDSEKNHAGNFAHNAHYHSHHNNGHSQYEDHTRKRTYARNQNRDRQRSNQDYRSYQSKKSSKASSQEDNRSFNNDRKNCNDRNDNQSYDECRYIPNEEDYRSYLNDRKSYAGKKSNDEANFNQNSRGHRNNGNNRSDFRTDDRQNSNNERKSFNDNGKPSNNNYGHKTNGKKNYADPYQPIALGENTNNSQENQNKYRNDQRNNDGPDGQNGSDDPNEYDQIYNNKNEKLYDPPNYHNGGQMGNAGGEQKPKKIGNHRSYNERENFENSRSLNNYQRTQDHSKRRSNYQGVNLIYGSIASDQASRLLQLPKNWNGNTQGINIINGNIHGAAAHLKQYQNDGRKRQQNANDERAHARNRDPENAYNERHRQDGHGVYNAYKGGQYADSDRWVIAPSTHKIIAFNNNNSPLPEEEQNAAFSADNTEFEYDPSASAPEVIYRSGDEIDFAETKLVDYDDNQRPLDNYKFSGKRGPQRKTDRTRSESNLHEDGYHYSKPSISFSS